MAERFVAGLAALVLTTASPALAQIQGGGGAGVVIGEAVIGHQSNAHGIAIDREDNVWIADEYRLVVYDANGKVVRTIPMGNPPCGLYVERRGQLWLAPGRDGQIFKIDWDGNVVGAVGNGPGRGDGQFV